jgi:hypothetical protein
MGPEADMSLDGSRGQYYQSRAVEVRAFAETCKDFTIQAQLETVAKEYEALAQSVEKGLLSR